MDRNKTNLGCCTVQKTLSSYSWEWYNLRHLKRVHLLELLLCYPKWFQSNWRVSWVFCIILWDFSNWNGGERTDLGLCSTEKSRCVKQHSKTKKQIHTLCLPPRFSYKLYRHVSWEKKKLVNSTKHLQGNWLIEKSQLNVWLWMYAQCKRWHHFGAKQIFQSPSVRSMHW